MTKRRSTFSRKVRKHRIKVRKVKLPPVGVLRVEVPPATIAVVAHDPIKNVVEIVPVPIKKVEAKKTWWQSLWE